MVDKLVHAGLGETGAGVTTEQEQLSYLATCRNATTLRKVVLATLLTAGEPPPAFPTPTTRTTSVTPERPGVATTAASSGTETEANSAEDAQPGPAPADVNAWIDGAVKEGFGLDKTVRDGDGDIPIPRGSAVLFIRHYDGKSE